MARSTARSSGTKKASPRKSSTAKKSTSDSGTSDDGTTKKSAQKSARKAPQQKSAQKKSVNKSTQKGEAPRAESRPSPRAGQVAARAAEELLELTGKEAEGVTGLERTEDGWTVHVEVLEVRRIPNTTDVLALYEVDTDRQGALQGYRRIRRYARGVPGED
jgi:hypothetical protein